MGAAFGLTRAEDHDQADDIDKMPFVFCETGTANADCGFVQTTDGAITLGTTALAYAQFSSAGVVTGGNGIDKTGNELSIDFAANGGLEFNGIELQVAKGIAEHDVAQFGAGVEASDFLRISGTAVVGLSASEVAEAIEDNIAAVGTIASGAWEADDIAVARGGTGASTHTQYSVLVGAGASALQSVAVGANEILCGVSGANPASKRLSAVTRLISVTFDADGEPDSSSQPDENYAAIDASTKVLQVNPEHSDLLDDTAIDTNVGYKIQMEVSAGVYEDISVATTQAAAGLEFDLTGAAVDTSKNFRVMMWRMLTVHS